MGSKCKKLLRIFLNVYKMPLRSRERYQRSDEEALGPGKMVKLTAGLSVGLLCICPCGKQVCIFTELSKDCVCSHFGDI